MMQRGAGRASTLLTLQRASGAPNPSSVLIQDRSCAHVYAGDVSGVHVAAYTEDGGQVARKLTSNER